MIAEAHVSSQGSQQFAENYTKESCMQEAAAGLSSSIKNGTLLKEQVCYRPLSQDGDPVIGPVPGVKGAFIATGDHLQLWRLLSIYLLPVVFASISGDVSTIQCAARNISWQRSEAWLGFLCRSSTAGCESLSSLSLRIIKDLNGLNL